MVLSAGLGTRLKPFTERTPKPLIPLYGIPCMEFALLSLMDAEVREAIVNLHAHPEQMRNYLKSIPVPGLAFSESDESAMLLGSAGGIRNALSKFNSEPFFSMNADVLHLAPLQKLQKRHFELKSKQKVLMTLVLASGVVLQSQAGEYREIFVNESSGLVTGFGEKKKGVPFFTGTAVFEPEAFLHLKAGEPSEFVPQVLEPAIRAGRVGFLYSDQLWLDVGTPEHWYLAELEIRERMQQGNLPIWLIERLKRSDPTVQGRFELGKNRIRLDDTDYEIKDLHHP